MLRKIQAILFFLAGLTFLSSAQPQMIPPANWTLSIDSENINIGDEVTLIFKTPIKEGFHIYSNDYGNCPPKKALFEFETNESYELLSKQPLPVGSHKYIDEIFECEVADFSKKAEFRQKIKVKSNPLVIKGILYYQMCNDGACVDHEFEFSKSIKVSSGSAKASGAGKTSPSPDNPKENDKKGIEKIENIEKHLNNTIDEQDSSSELKEISSQGKTTVEITQSDEVFLQKMSRYKAKNQDEVGFDNCERIIYEGGNKKKDEGTLWGFFFFGFILGLAALLTPCVFPMIPMTVSFFMKDSKKRSLAIRNGLIFGLSIVAVYTLIGVFVTITKNADFAHWLSTHWLPNILFFLIFVIFAISFFGAFEITLPSRFVNSMDKKADKGGLTGVFFMAFTIVLVSFSCTGPIAGSLVVESLQGARLKPTIGMLGFSIAFALPFTLFAIFPNWLKTIPKSGGWLNTVKVILGFIELAFGLKFLSVADQTYHWGLLDRNVYLALWIAIFTLMGLYLIGKIKFSHDSDMPFLKVPRLFLAIITFSFVIYIFPGLWGAPLKALAGYLPPMNTQDFDMNRIIRENIGSDGSLCEEPKYEDQLHIAHGINGYFDWEQGLMCARREGKPVFVDFTGHGCVNCRKVEEYIWSDPKVQKILKEDYLVISLYTDDKVIQLPPNEQFIAKIDGKEVTTLGKKNTYIQICLFGYNAQPQYALLDNEGELLQPTLEYETKITVEDYIEFLEKGLEEFKKRKTVAEN